MVLAERHRLADDADAAWKRASGALSDLSPRLAQLPLLFLEGEWAQARKVAESILSASRSNDAWRRYPGRFLGWIAREQDEPDVAWQAVKDEFPSGPGAAPGSTWFLPALELQRLAAALAIDGGDLDTARAWLQMHDRWLTWSGAVRGRAEGYLSWAAWASAGRDARPARRYAELAFAEASTPHQPLALCGAQRALGELKTASGQYAEAAIHLEAALALADACAAPYERALTLLALAHLCGATGGQSEQTALLAEASATCEALGARRTLARVHRLAVPANTRRDRYPDSLTAREVEVLALIASGISNQEIAERLVLSVRTVERHINSLYRKIAARGRADAVAYAARHGLLPDR